MNPHPVEILSVEVVEPLHSAGGFDLPDVGGIESPSFRVAMWFRRPAAERPGRIRLSLAASPQSEPVQWDLRLVLASGRGDVPCPPGEAALGFDTYVDGIDLPRHFEIVVTYLCRTGAPVMLGRIRGRRGSCLTDHRPRFQPLVVCSQGRTGTTALMRALAAHPACVLNDRYPYEDAQGSYYARMAATVLRTPDLRFRGDRLLNDRRVILRTWHSVLPSRFLHTDFRSYEEIEALQAEQLAPVADFARAAIDRTYARIAAGTGKRESGQYFVEKNLEGAGTVRELRAGTVRELLWFYERVKLIVVTREPLDAFRSARDFNAKRGFPAFGRETCKDDEAWIDHFCERTTGLADLYDQHPVEDRMYLRFEDLMNGPRGELERLCAFLGPRVAALTVDSMRERLERDDAQARLHRTRDPGHELDTWRSQLSPWEVERILERTRLYRERFGYAGGDP